MRQASQRKCQILLQHGAKGGRIIVAVITVELAGKDSFVYEANGQYNVKLPISLVFVSKPLITVTSAIVSFSKEDAFGKANAKYVQRYY